MTGRTRAKLALFLAGELLALGFLCAMQSLRARENLPLFAAALAGMHGGVICLILSRKRFRTPREEQLRRHYLIEYGLLALYLPVILLRHLGAAVPRSAVLILTAVAAAVSAVNTVSLHTRLKQDPP